MVANLPCLCSSLLISHPSSITSKPIISISSLLIRDGGGCRRTISYDLLVVDVSYLYLERGNRATKHVKRSWLNILYREGIPCPQAPGDVAGCTLDCTISKELDI